MVCHCEKYKSTYDCEDKKWLMVSLLTDRKQALTTPPTATALILVADLSDKRLHFRIYLIVYTAVKCSYSVLFLIFYFVTPEFIFSRYRERFFVLGWETKDVRRFGRCSASRLLLHCTVFLEI